MGPQSEVYRAAAADDMMVCPLDGIVAIFHRPSGQTHLVASPVPEILDALTDVALGRDALFASLCVQYDIKGQDDARVALDAHLTELIALGLVTTP